MGKYIRKRKGLGEIVVMEVAQVGVRTRARATAMAAANSGDKKRRKVSGGDELSFASSSLVDQLITPENSVSTVDSSDPCASASSDHVTDSFCSSDGSTRKERPELVDLEVCEESQNHDENAENETSRCNLDRRDRREITESTEFQAKAGELESKATPSEATSIRISMVERIPPEAELEEFFAAAEKSIHKKFTEKYNFDILKDVPLEGRYEWVKLKP